MKKYTIGFYDPKYAGIYGHPKAKTVVSKERWTLEQILNEINRDRSNDWTNYNENDWREGWNEWVEGEFMTLLDDVNETQHIVKRILSSY